MIYTPECLATAPKATITVTYPDGATFTRSLLSDGQLVGDVRAAMMRPDTSLSAILDKLRVDHADAFARSGNTRALSAWAARR